MAGSKWFILICRYFGAGSESQPGTCRNIENGACQSHSFFSSVPMFLSFYMFSLVHKFSSIHLFPFVHMFPSVHMKYSKALFLLSYIFVFAVTGMHAQVSFGDSQLFNSGWLFSMTDTVNAVQPSFDDSRWRQLDLPHDWSIEGTPSPTLASCTGYLPAGIGWYRKHFQVSDDKPLHFIYFEGVYNRSEVYLNGHLLGKRPNGYVSFMYELTPYLQSGDNVLTVRVDHSRYADSRWYTGSGIYRNVWLVSAANLHFDQWGVTCTTGKISSDKAQVNVGFSISSMKQNMSDVTVTANLFDADGKQVCTASKKLSESLGTMQFSVSKPHLWDIDTPYLYTLRLQLMKGNVVQDTTSLRIGLRSLTFDADKGFALNGKWIKVKGVCIHHDAGVLGAAVPREVWRRRFLTFKEMGVNGLRMSHNLQAPVIYDLADEMGFLIMDEGSDEWEYPKRKWMAGWNRGTPSYDGSYDFFNEWIDTDIRDMVRRDRNHPSVFMWSVGNEVDYPNDPYTHPILDGNNASINQPMYGGYKEKAPRAERIGFIAERLAKIIHANDPSRPVTGAMAGVVMSNQTIYPSVIDVCGYNYTENRYHEDHATYPRRIIYGSETSTNLSSWKAVRDNSFIFGQFVWTGLDYLGESGQWPSRGLNTGLVSFSGTMKPRGHFFQALWSTKPTVYIGTHPIRKDGPDRRPGNLSTDAWDSWNYAEGQTIRVLCYTNQPYARLLLNGNEVGKKKKYDDSTGIIHWDIPYQPGTLSVEGIDSLGAATASYEIKTHSEAKALHAHVDSLGHKSGDQVVHVWIDIVDEAGVRVLQAHNDVTCEIIEGGKLLGLENSDNSDMTAPQANHRNAFRGRLLAYIQKTSQKTTVRFSSEGFKSVEIEL